MANNQDQVMEGYIQYKDATLASYDRILALAKCKSAKIIIEELKAIENNHREKAQEKKEIVAVEQTFSELALLTPIDELNCLSKAVKHILSLKAQRLKSFQRMMESDKEEVRIVIERIVGSEHRINENLERVNSYISK